MIKRLKIGKWTRSFFLWCIRKNRFFCIYVGELRNIYKKRDILSKVKLTDSQKKEIDEFYMRNYGKKVHYWWHRLYQSYTGTFDAKYLPEYIFSLWLNPDIFMSMPYTNKNMIDVLFKDGSRGGEFIHLKHT